MKGARSATGVRISEPMKHELTQQDLIRQPAGVVSVAEVLSYFDANRFFDKKELAMYLSVSTRTIEKHLAEIPHYRLHGSMLRFKKSEIDEWVEQYRESNGDSLNSIADEVLESLK